MNKSRIFAGLLGLFVVIPIWFYLLYKVLEAVHASELMWFLYWVYLPVAVFVQAIAKFVVGEEK